MIKIKLVITTVIVSLLVILVIASNYKTSGVVLREVNTPNDIMLEQMWHDIVIESK